MRKKIVIGAVLFALCFAATLTFLLWARPAAAEEPAKPQLLVVVPEAVGPLLPAGCVKEVAGTCKAWLAWAWMPQVVTSEWLLADLWGRIDTPSGGYYHAFAYRRKVGTYWVWQVHGPRAFWSLFSEWKKAQPTVLLYQPHDALTNATLCTQLAPAWFVDITADSGIRQTLPPLRTNCAGPTDAGPGDCTVTPQTWPDGSTVNCASRWWLIRSRWGGPAPRPWNPSVDAGWGATTAPVPQGGPPIVVPDARVFKTCYQVPVGTACP